MQTAVKAPQAGSKIYSTSYATDMTLKEYSPIIGRDSEIQRLVEVLTRKNKSNAILVGDPGVGKTKLVNGLVSLIKEGIVPEGLRNKRVISIDLSLLGADLSVMKAVLDEVIANQDILFIDEIHNIVGAGKTTGSLDLANILKPLLTDGSLTCIGATTPEEYMRYFEKDAALERRFSKVQVDEPSFEACEEMLKIESKGFETHHGVKIESSAIKAAIELSARYITDRQLPDKAFDLIDEACSKKNLDLIPFRKALVDLKKFESESNWEKASEIKYAVIPNLISSELITDKEIADMISIKTGIPLSKLNESEKEKLLRLEETLKQRVVGQDQAIDPIASQIKNSRVGLNFKNLSFLLTGPSGSGKTETAKTIAQVLYGSEDNLIRLDMSEFAEKHSVSKLIGAPAGYIGYEDGGRLTEAVRRKPYSVILLDEVEKAHPDVYDTLLQVLDEGRLTDNKGRLIDFKNTVIIMTSNLNKDSIKEFFKTEFINRISELITFKALSKEDLQKVALIKLKTLSINLKQNKNISVEFSLQFVDKLVDMAYKPEYGSRALERLIQQIVLPRITTMILNNELSEKEIFVFQP